MLLQFATHSTPNNMLTCHFSTNGPVPHATKPSSSPWPRPLFLACIICHTCMAVIRSPFAYSPSPTPCTALPLLYCLAQINGCTPLANAMPPGLPHLYRHEQINVVYKFGGSSVRDAERMREVAGIICSFLEYLPCVVLSAMGKV